MKDNIEKKQPTFRFAMIVMVLIIVTLAVGLVFLKTDPHILMILDIVIVTIAVYMLGYRWDDVLEGMISGVHKAIGTLFFFFLIGMIVGAWILSGTVPALISYGLNILSPKFFLPAGLIICSITSLATGSSWSTAGTIGIALMGIGQGLGIPPALIAGMVISGSYFGDKMSPLSDTTNLAPAIAGTNIYDHIKAMLYTTIPAYVMALIIYAVMGLQYAGAEMDIQIIAEIQNGIMGMFNINLIVFIPLIVVLVTSALKVPPIPGMMAGIASSIPIAMILQGSSLTDVISVLNYGFQSESGIELVDKLLNRGGIQSMMWTFSLTVIALALGGILSSTGILNAIVLKIVKLIENSKYLPGATILTTFLVNLTMAEQYVSIILTGEIFKEPFERAELEPRMLSRCLEEGGTLTAPLIPWNTCGAVMFAALGVSAVEYAPYAFFNLLNPLFGILFPILGFSLLRKNSNLQKE